jgi:serralysin
MQSDGTVHAGSTSNEPSKSMDWGYQKGPGAFDIAAVQALYGPNTRYHTGNDTYTLPIANISGTGWTTAPL